MTTSKKSILLTFALVLLQVPQAQAPASIQGVIVRMGTSTPVAGARVNIGTAQTVTDDNGRFAFKDLPPGHHRVVATHNDYMPAVNAQRRGVVGADMTLAPGQLVSDLLLTMVPKGGIRGRVYDRDGNPVTTATVEALKHSYQDGRRILIQVRSVETSNDGQYSMSPLEPGIYIIRAVLQRAGTNESVLPVYYPNTTDASLASAIELPPGVYFNGLDLTVTDARPLRIRGRIVNGLDGASGIGVSLLPRRGTVSTGSLQRASISNGSAFEFRNIATGSYDVVASGLLQGGVRAAGSTPVEIRGSDIEDVTVSLQPQVSISGKVSIENEQSETSNFTRLRIQLRREPFIPELLILTPNIAPDGTFTLAGVTPGEYQLRVTIGGFQGYVKSARLGAINALNPPFHIDGQGQLEIVLSRKAGAIDALVVDDEQKAFPGATVVLVPDPPNRQRFDLYYAGVSDASGAAYFRSVAPGDYKLFAWDDVPSDAWQNADFIRSYEHLGKPVHIGEAMNQRIDVRITRASPEK